MHTIELDISYDCPLIELINDTKKYNIALKLITHNGPGGGNPIYAFFGNKSNLTQYCNDFDFPKENIFEVK